MEGKYEIDVSISREDARKVLARLATDTAFRNNVQAEPVAELGKLGIKVSPGLLPEEVDLPPMREIAHILYAADSLLDESASPFGLLIIFVFGAMPVTMGRSPAGDGAR